MQPPRPLMRLARLAAIVAAATAAAPSVRGRDSAGPDWRADYATAFEEARSSGRLLWIQFTGPWCPSCARMEQDSFPDPNVVARASAGFVPLKLRADAHQELALSFDVTGLPASVIVGPDRRVLAVRQGYLGPGDLDALLGETLAANAPSPTAELVGPPKPTIIEPPIKTERRVELAGACPVSLARDGVPTPGRADFAAEYAGKLYRLADASALALFRLDPERYVPADDGRCPVERVDADRKTPGDPRFAALYREKLYLCSSLDDRDRFLADPDRYAAAGVEAAGACPHCLAERGETVPGDPRHCLVAGGRRYWFPDDSHRGAFLTMAPPSSVRR